MLSDGLAESATKIPKEVWKEWDEEFRLFSEEAEELVEEQPEEKPETAAERGDRKILPLKHSPGALSGIQFARLPRIKRRRQWHGFFPGR